MGESDSPKPKAATIYMRQVRHVLGQDLRLLPFALAFLCEGIGDAACDAEHGFICSQDRAPLVSPRLAPKQFAETRSESWYSDDRVTGHDDVLCLARGWRRPRSMRCAPGNCCFVSIASRFVVTTAGGHGADDGLWNHRRSRRT